MFESYKGRELQNGKVARVYWNLHRDVFSIQQKVGKSWLVVGHASSMILLDAVFTVNEKKRLQVITEQKKNVHAMVVGRVPRLMSWIIEVDSYKQAYYNPYKVSQFVDSETRESLQYSCVDIVKLFNKSIYYKNIRGLTS
ncbi:hypothetical protein [Paenibacillus sp. Soil724D2]|uniref:hypothetical protein n=1 Tax=Paenibacillus sp. (strain Soil724D2) TaxID=1736392 RepID=UPI000AB6B18F|nr:hypothetical protein [Paenibacillus sp. Soil724D2]